jgi:hypothetical protein
MVTSGWASVKRRWGWEFLRPAAVGQQPYLGFLKAVRLAKSGSDGGGQRLFTSTVGPEFMISKEEGEVLTLQQD